MANLICFDFDDTIVLENTMRLLLDRFAAPSWREFEAAYRRGDLSVEQFNAAAFDTVDPEVTRADMETFVGGAVSVRPGFQELVDWADWNGWQCAVVSNGIDIYVETVLDALRLDRVVRHAGRAVPGYRWRLKYLSPRGIEVASGFKLSYAQAFRNAGDFVAYVGDGASDIAAARLAPAVFARSTLWESLQHEHPRIHHFESFGDIQSVLEREAETWLASFSAPAQSPITGQ